MFLKWFKSWLSKKHYSSHTHINTNKCRFIITDNRLTKTILQQKYIVGRLIVTFDKTLSKSLDSIIKCCLNLSMITFRCFAFEFGWTYQNANCYIDKYLSTDLWTAEVKWVRNRTDHCSLKQRIAFEKQLIKYRPLIG